MDGSRGSVYMYGLDADALFAVVKPILRASAASWRLLLRFAAVRRFLAIESASSLVNRCRTCNLAPLYHHQSLAHGLCTD